MKSTLFYVELTQMFRRYQHTANKILIFRTAVQLSPQARRSLHFFLKLPQWAVEFMEKKMSQFLLKAIVGRNLLPKLRGLCFTLKHIIFKVNLCVK